MAWSHKRCCANPYKILRQIKNKENSKRIQWLFYIFIFFKETFFVLDADISCALSLHLMLTSGTLKHSFDISVAVCGACNLLAANWVGVRATALVRSDLTGTLFELLGWNFQRLSRIDWATKWRWQRFFCNFSSRIRWQLRIILDKTMYFLRFCAYM